MEIVEAVVEERLGADVLLAGLAAHDDHDETRSVLFRVGYEVLAGLVRMAGLKL